MAIVHRATISPTKQQFVTAFLDGVPWGGAGEVEMVGGYRFDDPAGEVGVESLVVRRDGQVLQLPLTYRGAPLERGELVTTMEHSVLGPRWIYLAASDPVGVSCYVRSLLGEQEQAVTEMYDGDRLVETRPHTVRVSLSVDGPADPAASDAGEVAPDAAVVEVERGRLVLPHVLGADPGGVRRLVGEWEDGGPAVVAALNPS